MNTATVGIVEDSLRSNGGGRRGILASASADKVAIKAEQTSAS